MDWTNCLFMSLLFIILIKHDPVYSCMLVNVVASSILIRVASSIFYFRLNQNSKCIVYKIFSETWIVKHSVSGSRLALAATHIRQRTETHMRVNTSKYRWWCDHYITVSYVTNFCLAPGWQLVLFLFLGIVFIVEPPDGNLFFYMVTMQEFVFLLLRN